MVVSVCICHGSLSSPAVRPRAVSKCSLNCSPSHTHRRIHTPTLPHTSSEQIYFTSLSQSAHSLLLVTILQGDFNIQNECIFLEITQKTKQHLIACVTRTCMHTRMHTRMHRKVFFNCFIPVITQQTHLDLICSLTGYLTSLHLPPLPCLSRN